jgi:hypothetical protein
MPEGVDHIAWMALFFFLHYEDLSPKKGFGGGHRVEGIRTVGVWVCIIAYSQRGLSKISIAMPRHSGFQRLTERYTTEYVSSWVEGLAGCTHSGQVYTWE